MKKVIGFVLSLMVLLVGCSLQSEQGVEISVDNTIPRGIESTSMVADSYSVIIREGTTEIGRYDIPRDSGKLKVMLEVGNYDFEAVAFNKDGIAIGGGKRTVEVVPGKISDCTIVVREYEGEGTLSTKVLYDGTGSLSLAVWMPNAELATAKPVKVQALTGNGKEYTGKISLDRGYWIIAIIDGNCNRLSRFETVRITSGREAIWTVDLSGNTSGNIDDQIKPTPYVKILGNEFIEPGTESTFTVETGNISNPRFAWFVDGLQVGTGNTLTWTAPADSNGKYRLDVIAQGENIAWSDSIELRCRKAYEYEVSGKTEFRLDGKVLLPWYFTVDCSGASLVFDREGFGTLERKAMWNAPEAGTVSFILPDRWTDYDLTFENRGTEGEYDIVYVMVDREIADAAYLDISFNVVNTPTELGLGVCLGSDSLNPDSTEDWGHLGLFLIPADKVARRIKIDPGTYSMCGTSGIIGSLGVIALETIGDEPFEVLPGASYELSVIEKSSRVSFKLPDPISENCSFVVTDSEGKKSDNSLHVSEGSFVRDEEFGIYDYLVRIPKLGKAFAKYGVVIDSNTTEVVLEEIPYEKSFYISMSDQFYENGSTMKARIVPNGITDPVVKWWIDGVEASGNTLTIERPVTGDAQSVHTIKADVHDGAELIGTAERTVVWCPEKLKEVTVSGDVEYTLITDIVFNEDLEKLDVTVDGKHYTYLGMNEYYYRKSSRFAEDVVMSAAAKAPYDYWLYTWKEGDVTKVYFVLDQELEAYGVLNLEWNCPIAPQKAGSIWEFINGSRELVVAVNDYLDGATLKMVPSDYTITGMSSAWSGNYSYHFSSDKKDFTITADASCDLKFDSGL